MCDLCGACRQFTGIVLFALLVGASFGLGGYAVKLYLLVYATDDVTLQELLASDSEFWEYSWEYSLWFTGVWVAVFLVGLVVYIAVTQTVTCFAKWVLLRALEAVGRMILWCFPFLDCGCMGRKKRSAREAYMYAQAPISYEMSCDVLYEGYAPQERTRPRTALGSEMPLGIRLKRAQEQPADREAQEIEQELLDLV